MNNGYQVEEHFIHKDYKSSKFTELGESLRKKVGFLSLCKMLRFNVTTFALLSRLHTHTHITVDIISIDYELFYYFIQSK